MRDHRNRIFEDLHDKGFWLTGALKYGGDFLAYNGDPRHHHAEYIVVIAARDEPIQVPFQHKTTECTPCIPVPEYSTGDHQHLPLPKNTGS
jgi:hypothetical protein